MTVSFLDQLADRLAIPVEGAEGRRWRDVARADQLPPGGDWLTWVILAGRGFGKTRTGAETAAEWARTYPGARIALVAITFADGRDTMVEGESGLLSVLSPAELRGGSVDTAWNRSLGELFLGNGSRFKIYSSERPRQLRGPQHHFGWGDEFAQWLDASKGTAKDTTWSNFRFGLRLKPRPDWPSGYRPRAIMTSTPRPLPLLLVRPGTLARNPERAGLLQMPRTAVTRGNTFANEANLSPDYIDAVVRPLMGTTLGRQELEAEVIEDVEGALLSRALIDRGRRLIGEVPVLPNTVVAVDPAVSTGEDSDETAVVAVAADSAGDGWVLRDRTVKAAPSEWGVTVWELVIDTGASAIVVEDNQGGDMVQHTLETCWETVRARRARAGKTTPVVPIVRVHPVRGQGKWQRASALQPLYEQGRIHHVSDPAREGELEELEDQWCTWTGDKGEDSPDRVDAVVHGITYLLFPRQRAARKSTGGERGARWGGGSGRR